MRVKTTTIDVNDLDHEKGRIEDQDANGRRHERTVKDRVNAIEIGKGIEMEGKLRINFVFWFDLFVGKALNSRDQTGILKISAAVVITVKVRTVTQRAKHEIGHAVVIVELVVVVVEVELLIIITAKRGFYFAKF